MNAKGSSAARVQTRTNMNAHMRGGESKYKRAMQEHIPRFIDIY